MGGGGGGGGGGSYLSGFDLEFCTCKHAPPRGIWGHAPQGSSWKIHALKSILRRPVLNQI